mgnify:CR=1 FL=1
MKNLWISIKITLAMCVVLFVGYVLVLRLVAWVASPNDGEAPVVTYNGKVVGAANVGQVFTDSVYFWGRPSNVDYNGGGSGGSNKGTNNPEYLAQVEERIDAFLAAHPYLSREEVPAEMVTASGSGLDPDISPRGAQVQVRRVAAARGLDEAVVQRLVDSLTQKPWLGLFGTAKVNVLRLNIALETLQPNVTASAGVRQAGGGGGGGSPEN